MQAAPIDLRPFREGDDADRRRVARQFDEAGRRSGFFAVTGHGVDPDLIDAMLAVTTAFFDLPAEDKMACYLPDRALNRGYAPEGSEALAYSLGERDLPNDLFEAYNIGRHLTAAQLVDPYFADQRDRYFAENVWPSVPAGMRATGAPTGTRPSASPTTSWTPRRWPSICRRAGSGRSSIAARA